MWENEVAEWNGSIYRLQVEDYTLLCSPIFPYQQTKNRVESYLFLWIFITSFT